MVESQLVALRNDFSVYVIVLTVSLTEVIVESIIVDEMSTGHGQIFHFFECLAMRLDNVEGLSLLQKRMNIPDGLHQTAQTLVTMSLLDDGLHSFSTQGHPEELYTYPGHRHEYRTGNIRVGMDL